MKSLAIEAMLKTDEEVDSLLTVEAITEKRMAVLMVVVEIEMGEVIEVEVTVIETEEDLHITEEVVMDTIVIILDLELVRMEKWSQIISFSMKS
jgi:hypothetical protein